jgi:aryl-alcohol dehydrogenase-like predicted oxidoreductase
MGRKKITRRQFVTRMTAGTGAALAAGNILASSPVAGPSYPETIKQTVLGKTGIKTTLLGMGTGFSGWNRSSNITRSGVAESVIRQAYEKGVRYFDCADSYGTHLYTAAALHGFPRESYVLGTKIWYGQGGIPEPDRPDADKVVERFRKELNTDYIDLIQIHCMTDAAWTDKQKKQMDILEDLKARKIIRAHGVSVHSLEAMEACAGSPWTDVVHVRINPFGEAMDKEDPSLVVPVIEKLHKEGKGIIGMKLIGAGKYRDQPGKIDESLKYVLGLGTVDMIIIGFEMPGQIDDYSDRLKRALG